MLVEDDVLIVTGHNPLVDRRGARALAKDHLLEFERLALVKFQPDQLIIAALHRLLVQIMQTMKALAHAPIQQNNAQLAAEPRTVQHEFGAGHGESFPNCRMSKLE